MSRGGFLSSDAVGIIAGQGDRIDALERQRPDLVTNDLVASYVPLTTIPGDGSDLDAGRITLPRGYSRMMVAVQFQVVVGGETLGSAGIVFPPGWEDAHVLTGGFTSASGLTSSFVASGVGLLRSSETKTDHFYVRATSSGGGDVRMTGALFVQPVGSIAAN